MLIKSDRHTASDLRLWDDLLEQDVLHGKTSKYKRHVEITQSMISQFIEKNRDYYLAVSWGKDSVVMAHIFHKLGAKCKYVYFSNTNKTTEGCFAVRDAFLDRFAIDYEEHLYNYANADVNDSTFFGKDGKHVKWFAIQKMLKAKYGCHVTGVRFDESNKRKLRFVSYGAETKNSFAPFRYMDVYDIFAYLAEHDLPTHPNYAMLGGGRWDKYRIRVAMIGHKEGDGIGRAEWEREYYPDVLNRLQAKRG